MSRPDVTAVMPVLRPGAQWLLDGDPTDLSGLVMLDGGPPPTQTEVDEAWPELVAERQERETSRKQALDELAGKADDDPVTAGELRAAGLVPPSG